MLYSDNFVNVNVQDFNPNWGEDSQLIQSLELYADSGATALHMSNLSFQGIQISGGDQPALDVSGHNSLHIDMWSATDGHVDLFLVSGDWPNNAETSVKLEVSAGSWNSFNIDLGAYADAVDLTNVTQMKFDKGDSGLSEFYIDNLLFSSAAPDYALPVQGPVVESYPIDVTFYAGSDDAEAFGGAAIEHTIEIRPELVTAVADSTDLTSLGNLDQFADRIDLDGQDVYLTVEQAGLEVIGGGSYNVVDGADLITDELSADSAGVIDDASSVSTTDGDLVLTVAQFKQLVDGDRPHIGLQHQRHGRLSNRDIRRRNKCGCARWCAVCRGDRRTDHHHCGRRQRVARCHHGLRWVRGRRLVHRDSSAFDDGLEGILTGAVSVKVGATASLTVAELLLEDADNMDPPAASTASWIPWRR